MSNLPDDVRSGSDRSATEAGVPAPRPEVSKARRRGRHSLTRTGVALGLLLLSLLLLAGVILAEVRSDKAVERVHEVQDMQYRVTGAVTYAATAQRTYLLTRDWAYRDRYEREAAEARALLDETERLTAGDPEQRAQAAGLRPLVEADLGELALTLRLADTGDAAAALDRMREGRGTRLLDILRERAAAVAAEEAGLAERQKRTAHLLVAVLVLPLVLLVAVALWLPVSELRQLERDYEEERQAEAAQQRAETAQRQAEAAQQRAEAETRAKADFLAAMSHEIRTPMTGVLGMADLLAAEELGGRQRGYVEAIRTSGRHLLGIINDVLDFSRIEAGGLALERVDFSPAEILEQVRSLMAPQVIERGLALEFKLDEQSPPVVRGDPTRLRQVLLNLVGNGLKFTPEGGVTVYLTSRPAGEGRFVVRFEVRDTGIGMTPEQRAGLFRPFAQADRSTTRHYGGTGLGLAISKRLVEAMNGVIGAESAPGQGSLFWFEVPLERGDVVVAAARVAFDPAPAAPLRLLLVEDVAVNRELLGEMLGRQGHAVAFAADGAEAVEAVVRERFDAVLMDVQMPVMGGLEATRRIRQLPAPAGIVPILGLTANVLEEERRRCLAAGMDRCLTKPVAWPELFAALAEVAERPAASPSEAAAAEDEMPLLAGVAAGPADARLAGLLGKALAEVERGCARLRALPAGSPELAGEAHRLRGAAGLYGLARVSAVAGEIEAAAREGREVASLVERLAAAVVATREALREAGHVTE